MRILALGATGAIGAQLTDVLVERGHQVAVTSRQKRLSTGNISYIQGNAHDDRFLKEILRGGWDAIVDFMVYDTSRFLRRSEYILDASRQYVFISTGRVFANSEAPLTEISPRLLDTCKDQKYLATDEYALAKARQEDILRNSGRTNWTIVRPYITFGDGRLQLGTLEKESWLYRALQGRSIVFCDALMEKFTTLTDGVDVARMMAQVIGNSDALGEDYNLTGSQPVTWNDVLSLYIDEFERALGRRPAVSLLSLEAFCDASKSLSQVLYDRVYDRRFDPCKVSTMFDVSKLEAPLPALAARLQSQLLAGRAFGRMDWRNEALRDRFTGEHARLTEMQGLKSKLGYLGYRHIPPGLIKRVKRT